MAKTPCACGRPKKAGHPKWCLECWLRRQPIGVREAQRTTRLALIPDDLRKRLWPPKTPLPRGRRWCSGCQTLVLFEDVADSATRCRTCVSVGGHATRMVSEYGVSRDFYDALYTLQGGRCALCNRAFGNRRPAFDHDHRTGAPRGLLCSDDEWGCNLKVMARFDADPNPVAMAYRLVDYLSDPPAGKVQVKA